MEAPAPIENAATIRRRRARRAYLVLGAVAILVLAIYGAHWFLTRDQVSTDDAVVEADVVPLALRVGGAVRAVHIRDHQRVARGDLLIEIDPADLEARLRQAEAELEASRATREAADAQVRIARASSSGGQSSARAQLAGTGAGVKAARARVEAARAARARAQAEAREADSALARARHLAEKSAATAKEVEEAEAAGAAAGAAVSAAVAQVAAAEEEERGARTRVDDAAGRVEQTGALDAQVAVAEAQAQVAAARVATAEAAVEQARLQLSYTRLVAPSDGVASQLAVRSGQVVVAGQLALELVPPTTYVIARFKETDIQRIHPGQAVDIEVDALGARELHGRVDSVAPATSSRFSLLQPENGTGNFVKVVKRIPVKINWEAEGGAAPVLQPGLSAEVTVHVD
ncbi:MAG TPA: HlyD family secretion protein [Kofleriaceae bacterium]|jgi:membrane fusion protein (multidrug efflux system)